MAAVARLSAGWHRWDGADLLLAVQLQPRADRDELKPEALRLWVRITAPPIDGAANRHLLAYLAREFGVVRARAVLVRGGSGRAKLVRITAPTALPAALAPHLARARPS